MITSFEKRKTVEIVVYISNKTQDVYHIMKALYYADLDHLEKYGRPIIHGEYYRKMKDGPVPSCVFDVVKTVRGENKPDYNELVKGVMKCKEKDKNSIIPLRESDFDYLAESEIESLDIGINKIAHLTFAELKALVSKEAPYIKTKLNKLIPLESMIESLSNGQEILDYMNS